MSILTFNPPVIAHRGASAYAPENTMAAFTKAAQLGIKWIEFDVMQAACGEPIIFHDERLERTTDRSGDVDRHPYQYLSTLDAGKWFDPTFSGETIPTLHQLMTFLHDAKMSANVELKSLPGDEEKLVLRVLEEMKHDLSDPHYTILFSSFSMDALRHLRAHSSTCLIGLLLHEWEPNWEVICESLQCVSVHVNHEIMTPEAAKKIKNMNKMLLCYTVNDASRAMELYSWGVDAVFSDAPDRVISFLQP